MDDRCSKFAHEVYTNQENPEIIKLTEYLSKLRDSLNISQINKSDYEVYRFTVLSSLYRSVSIMEIENRIDNQYFTYKKFSPENGYSSRNSQIDTIVELSNYDWETIRNWIYQYKFWTANEYKSRLLADGWGLIIECHRPDAIKCNKRIDHTIFRGNPEKDDEIGLMFYEIDSTIFAKYTAKMHDYITN